MFTYGYFSTRSLFFTFLRNFADPTLAPASARFSIDVGMGYGTGPASTERSTARDGSDVEQRSGKKRRCAVVIRKRFSVFGLIPEDIANEERRRSERTRRLRDKALEEEEREAGPSPSTFVSRVADRLGEATGVEDKGLMLYFKLGEMVVAFFISTIMFVVVANAFFLTISKDIECGQRLVNEVYADGNGSSTLEESNFASQLWYDATPRTVAATQLLGRFVFFFFFEFLLLLLF
jgi:hypothetical protein